MRKLIAALNLTIDGFCDHTAGIADDELHQHYTEMIRDAGALLYGRTTYQLMENFWPTIIKNPTGNKALDDFAIAIQNIPKIVFSRTLHQVTWENSTLAKGPLEEEALKLKQSNDGGNKDIYVGSPSLIAALTKSDLFDEYQLCVHPVIAGSGLPLFKGITDRIVLKLLKTKTFGSGAMVHFYAPQRP